MLAIMKSLEWCEMSELYSSELLSESAKKHLKRTSYRLAEVA
jgi:hypothetical protein